MIALGGYVSLAGSMRLSPLKTQLSLSSLFPEITRGKTNVRSAADLFHYIGFVEVNKITLVESLAFCVSS
jgi:hypothetical protein